jgi:hemerythrin-like domain-containing protein
MKVTDRLKVEHGVFLEQLRFLEELVVRNAPPLVLRAVVETIAAAEERHSQVEEQVLFPAVTDVMGPDFTPLLSVQADHRCIQSLTAQIQAGDVDREVVLRYVDVMRTHMEEEIHGLFPLIDEILGAERLETMANWNAEHVLVEMGKKPFA